MGFFKGIKKTFKKVFDVAKVVVPIALAAGAIIFTGGAALGLAPLGIAGGWGAAATAMTSSLGLTGALGSVLTGAVTAAGFGSLAGGALSAITGGDPLKGMQQGALAGAITGGVAGGLGFAPAASGGEASSGLSSSVTTTPATAAPQTGFTAQAASSGPAGNLGAGFQALSQPVAAAPSVSMPVPSMGGAAPASTAATTGGAAAGGTAASAPVATAAPANGFSGLLERNQTLIGHAISGVGQAMLTGGEAEDVARLRAEEEERRRATYAMDPSVYSSGGFRSSTNYQTPEQKFGRRRVYYDRASGQIVRTA